MEVVLETRSLILRPFKADDLDALVEGLNHIEVARWLAFVPHPYRREDGLKWIEHCAQLSSDKGEPRDYEFAIEHKAERAMIGGVSLNNIDRTRGTAGGGIWINAACHRRGYGHEAFSERIRFAFDTLGLHELHNGYFLGNEPSWNLQKRFGYKHTAAEPRRRTSLADGLSREEVLTSLRREDWIGR